MPNQDTMDDDSITFVALVANSDPEQFAIITMSADRTAIRRTVFGSEGDIWAMLHKAGMPDQEITAKIRAARENPH